MLTYNQYPFTYIHAYTHIYTWLYSGENLPRIKMLQFVVWCCLVLCQLQGWMKFGLQPIHGDLSRSNHPTLRFPFLFLFLNILDFPGYGPPHWWICKPSHRISVIHQRIQVPSKFHSSFSFLSLFSFSFYYYYYYLQGRMREAVLKKAIFKFLEAFEVLLLD